MRVEPLGDRGLIVRALPIPAWKWADEVNNAGIPGLIEAYASYETVGLEIDPAIFRPSDVLGLVIQSVGEAGMKRHSVPVCYEMGDDLGTVASTLGLKESEVVDFHSGSVYQCQAVGFCPGFPYLSGLDPRLHGIPRRPSPRPRIEPGSVAITGAQSGIYPMVRPGGWAILGRTPLTLVDVEDRYFPIRAGDKLTFRPIGTQEFEALKGERL